MAEEIEYNEGERTILRQAEAMKELSETKLWREHYVPLLDSMISTREKIVSLPLVELPQEYGHLDFEQKVLLLEHIKGALIGLRLARDLPASLLTHAREIREDHAPQSENEQ